MTMAALGTAIRHLKDGDWQQAHGLVQNETTEFACWVHGIVHILEGDIGNARYWYRRAGRAYPRDGDAVAEIEALARAWKERKP